MLSPAIVLFLVAALGGIAMAVKIFQNQQPSALLAVGHGALAAIGLVLAFGAAIVPDAPKLVQGGFVALLLAALGGFFLLSFHFRQKPHPKAVVVLHALLAVGGVGCLLLVVLQ